MATLAQRLQAEIDRANETTSKTDTTVHNAIGSLIDGYGQGGIEQVTWHQCPEAVRNYLDYLEAHPYSDNDLTVTYINTYAPQSADVNNTKPIGKTIDGVTYYDNEPNVAVPFSTTNKAGTLTFVDRLRWYNTTPIPNTVYGGGYPRGKNCRDLGGWNCDGTNGTVKYGLLVRGSEPNPADKGLMVDSIGIKTEVQLLPMSEQVEQFKKKTVGMAIGSAIAAFINLVLKRSKSSSSAIPDSSNFGTATLFPC